MFTLPQSGQSLSWLPPDWVGRLIFFRLTWLTSGETMPGANSSAVNHLFSKQPATLACENIPHPSTTNNSSWNQSTNLSHTNIIYLSTSHDSLSNQFNLSTLSCANTVYHSATNSSLWNQSANLSHMNIIYPFKQSSLITPCTKRQHQPTSVATTKTYFVNPAPNTSSAPSSVSYNEPTVSTTTDQHRSQDLLIYCRQVFARFSFW